jgi:FkbM family methyltransferase
MKVWGARVRPPSLDRAAAAWLLNAGIMGRAERRFFEEVVTRGQVVVDVGANQGIYTLLFSRLVGPQGRVFALEPAPSLFTALDENCRINHAENVTRLPTAAGAVRSRGLLRLSRFNQGDNRLTGSSKGPSVRVDVVPLDELLPTDPVSLVKIDVQGFEMAVVKGMQAIIERSPEIRVVFEYWPAGLGHAGPPRELLDFFVDRRFSLFELSSAGRRRLAARDRERLTRMGNWSWRNLLAVRE